MPKTKLQKQETVQQLSEKFQRAKSIVFTDYKGLTMSELSDIRAKLRDQQAEFSVTKNSLVKLALKDYALSAPDDQLLAGPTATLISFEDEITPIKTVVKALKDYQKGQVKGGFLDKQFLDKYRVTALSALPSKPELQAKVVGVLVAPLSGMVGVLQANLRNLVYALNQVRVQKGGE